MSVFFMRAITTCIAFAASAQTSAAQRQPIQLSLQGALERANQVASTQKNASDMRESSAVLSQAVGRFLPKVTAVGSREILLGKNQGFLQGELQLYDRGRAIQQTRIESGNEKVSQLQYLSAVKSQKIKIIESYFRVVHDRERVHYLEKVFNQIKIVRDKLELLVQKRAAAKRQLRRITQESIVVEQRLQEARLSFEENLNTLKILTDYDAADALLLDKSPDYPITREWENSLQSLRKETIHNSESLAAFDEQSDQFNAKKWLAYSEYLPSVALRAQYGFPGFNHAKKASTVFTLNVELPLPWDLPLFRGPINQVVAEQKKQVELAKEEKRIALEAEVDLRYRRVLQANRQLESTKTLLKFAEEDRADEEKMFIHGIQDGSSLVVYLQQEQTIRLNVQNFIRIKDTDFAAIQVLTTAEQ